MKIQTRMREIRITLFDIFKEFVMVKTIKYMITMLLISPILLSSCGVIPIISGLLSVSQPEVDADLVLPPVFGPEAAREAALEFVQLNFGRSAPSSDLIWVGDQDPTDGMVGSSTAQYLADGWSARVTFPLVAPNATIYTVKIDGDVFAWEGLINAYGEVVTTTVSLEPTPNADIVDPTPSDAPVIGTRYYRDDFHRLPWNIPQLGR